MTSIGVLPRTPVHIADDGKMRSMSRPSSGLQPGDQARPGSYLDTAAYRALQPVLVAMRCSGLVFARQFPGPNYSPSRAAFCRAATEQAFSTLLLLAYSVNLIKSFFTLKSDEEFGSPLFIKIMVTAWYAWCQLNAIAFYIASYRYHALPEFIIKWNELRRDNPVCRRKAIICVTIATIFITINMMFCAYVIFVHDIFIEFMVYPLHSDSDYTLVIQIVILILYIFYQCCWVLPVAATYILCAVLFYEFRAVNDRLEHYVQTGSEDVHELVAIRRCHQKVRPNSQQT